MTGAVTNRETMTSGRATHRHAGRWTGHPRPARAETMTTTTTKETWTTAMTTIAKTAEAGKADA